MKKVNLIFIAVFSLVLSTSILAQDYALNFIDNGYTLKNTVTVNGINLNGNSTFSVEALCNLTSYRENAPIVVKENGYNCHMKYVAFYLFVDVNGNPGLGIGNGTDFLTVISDVQLMLNEWYHIAATWDGFNVKIYIDGIESGTGPVTGSMWDEGAEMNIGNRWQCVRRSFNGMIDELRVWSDTRNALEINENMTRQLLDPTSEIDLVAYYKFDEGSGNMTYDAGLGGYNGVLGGVEFLSGTSSAPEWVLSTALSDCFNVDLGDEQIVYYGYNPMACASLTANVSDGSPPYSYLWSNGETSQSIEVCPEESTVYSVEVVDANLCSVIEDVVVEVVDVRCGWNNNRIQICHTSFWCPDIQYTLCVRSWLVPILLYFGDELGSCNLYKNAPILGEIPDFETVEDIRSFDERYFKENIESNNLIAQSQNELVVYPNPVEKIATIQFEVSVQQQTTIEILNSLGQILEVVYSGKPNINEINSLDWDSKNYSNGIYFVRLINGSKLDLRKISISN